jgi:hypothetical protein
MTGKRILFYFIIMLFYCFPAYSGYGGAANNSSGIDKSFIQSEIDAVDMKIKDLKGDIRDLNSRKKAFDAQISILYTQRLLDALSARSSALDLKITASSRENSAKRSDKLKAKLTVLNREIAIRREILELYKLQFEGDKSMQKGKKKNLSDIDGQIKLRNDEISALYPENFAAKMTTQTPLASSEEQEVQMLLKNIETIDEKIAVDRQKLDVLDAQEVPLRIQLKSI